jgi:hypothetical protein
MEFSLVNPQIPTTLFSTSRLVKLKANIDQATGITPLSEKEVKVMNELIPRFFSGEGYESIRSWEGIETNKVWAKIGKALLAGYYAKSAETRGSLQDYANEALANASTVKKN